MHPLRKILHNELHSRPSIYFREPAHVYHYAFADGEHTCGALAERLNQAADTTLLANDSQALMRLGDSTLKWERHTEFFTVTLMVPKRPGDTDWPAVPTLLESLVADYPQMLINAVQVLVESEEHWAGNTAHYGFKDPAGSTIGSNDAIVWSDFRLAEDGTNRMLLVNRRLNAYRLGRMIRRLLEIETYRMMASLTLPVAQKVSQELKEYEKELTQLSDRNAEGKSSAKDLSADITALSARIVRSTARTRQRFSATEAYAQLVFERIHELRESHVNDCQRLGVFIERRFRPTVRYCAATNQRLVCLGQSVANLGDLLQARVQVEMEEQNAEILQSLSTRADTQIKIQKAVEGLSIIAISYYLLSLFKLLYAGLHSIGLEISPKVAIFSLAPVAVLILGGIFLRIRRAKRH